MFFFVVLGAWWGSPCHSVFRQRTCFRNRGRGAFECTIIWVERNPLRGAAVKKRRFCAEYWLLRVQNGAIETHNPPSDRNVFFRKKSGGGISVSRRKCWWNNFVKCHPAELSVKCRPRFCAGLTCFADFFGFIR